MTPEERRPALVEFPTSYLIAALPPEMVDDIDGNSFTLQVEWRGNGKWRVQRGALTLDADLKWTYGSKDDDEFLSRTRFDRETALRLAREAALSVVVNGYTVSDAIRMWETRRGEVE